MSPAQVQLCGTHPELGCVREKMLGACRERAALRHHLLLRLEGTALRAQHLLALAQYMSVKPPTLGWGPQVIQAGGETTSSSPQQDSARPAVE